MSDWIIQKMKKIEMKNEKKSLPSLNVSPSTLRFIFFDLIYKGGMI